MAFLRTAIAVSIVLAIRGVDRAIATDGGAVQVTPPRGLPNPAANEPSDTLQRATLAYAVVRVRRTKKSCHVRIEIFPTFSARQSALRFYFLVTIV